MKRKKIISEFFIYLFLLIGILIILFPMYITIITALKTPAESSKNFFAFPSSFYLGNFKQVINNSNFPHYVFNSLFITVISLLIIAVVIPMVSYSISRNIKKKYYSLLYIIFVSGAFVPFTVVMVPQIRLMTNLHMLSKYGLILLYLVFALSEGVLLTVGYVKSIPVELEEAAYIDGCSVTQTFFKIIYPLMLPIVMAVVIIDGLWIWNDFQLPLLMLNGSNLDWTLPLFQYNFKTKYSFDYNMAFASFFMSIIPIMIFYFFTQKNLIDGLTTGSVKN